MRDLKDIVAGCMKGDGASWNEFFKRYDQFILKKVKQAFVVMGTSANDEELRGAYDYVVDEILFGRGLQNYRHENSLEGFLQTIVRRKTIDWLRRKTTEKKMFGASGADVTSLDLPGQESVDPYEDSSQPELCAHLSPLSRIMFKLLLIRYYDLDAEDLTEIEAQFGVETDEIESRVDRLRSEMEERFLKGDGSFSELSVVHAQMILLAQKNQRHESNTPEIGGKLNRKRAQYDRLLDKYHKKGFEELPRQRELADVLGCNIKRR